MTTWSTSELNDGRRQITRPEKGSLYRIMRDNAGTSLYLRPVYWVDIHTQLLGVRFHQRGSILRPLPARGPSDSYPLSDIAIDMIRNLNVLLSLATTATWLAKTQALKKVMEIMFPATLSHAKSDAELHLYFGDRVYPKVVPAPLIWECVDDDACRSTRQ